MQPNLAGLLACTAAAMIAGHQRADRQAPLDAITAIVDAFGSHAVVAIDEPHGDERSHAFRMSLIRDRRFTAVVDDILVEFGNSRYQDVMDRFVAGAPVAHLDVKRVWQNTTLAGAIWDRPIYEEFYRCVRAINATLPPERRLRVLLGDPPIDWDAIRTTEDLMKARQALADRSGHPADVLVRETLSKARRALVVYGSLHLIRQNLQGANLIERVEKTTGTRAFIVLTHPFASLEAAGMNPASWPLPGLALAGGSSLARQMDAVLYLGPASTRTFSRLPAELCADRRYREMRVRRMTLAGHRDAADQLRKECRGAR